MHNKDPYTILLSAAFAIPEVPDQWNCCWPLGLHSFTYMQMLLMQNIYMWPCLFALIYASRVKEVYKLGHFLAPYLRT